MGGGRIRSCPLVQAVSQHRIKRAVMNRKPIPRPTKRILLRFLAILLGFFPLLALEIGLRIAHFPPSKPAIDPLVDLHHLQPLFTLSSDRQRYFIGPERQPLFRPAQFAAAKPKGTFRIFALGGSTTQGEPYSTETAFPEWMKINLEAATEGDKIEAINCGGLSYASYRVRAILEEVLGYEPDLIVIYSGQNEFLERRSYEGWRRVPLPLARAGGWLTQMHVIRLGRGLLGQETDQQRSNFSQRTQLQKEVDALLDYSGGLNDYHRDDPWREPVTAHFRWNLQQMVARCQSAGVPVVLVRPVVNLLDCPPMKFEPLSNLDVRQRSDFEAAWAGAQAASQEPELARQWLLKAYAIDPEHAGVNFFLGRLAWEGGQWDLARQYLQAAKDFDVCPLRALTAIQEAVTEVAQQFQVPCVDAERLFSERSDHGVVGNRWLVDHVHPTIEGHQLLGEALCELSLEQGWLPTREPNWREHRADRVRAHLSSLGEDYFHRGKQRLQGLLLWTQGRAKKIRPN